MLKKLILLSVALYGVTVFAQNKHEPGMYWSECHDWPPGPVNFWCPDCHVTKQDDGSFMVEDCADVSQQIAARSRQALKKGGIITPFDVPNPDDGTNTPTDLNFWYVVGNGCPGGSNHPVNVAPIGWLRYCHHGGSSITSWGRWDQPSPPFDGNGDALDILWHKQCTNHATWAAFTLYGVHYDATNDAWSTNSIQAYQTNNPVRPLGRWFFNDDPTNIVNWQTNNWLAICTNAITTGSGTNSTNDLTCFGIFPPDANHGWLWPPIDDGVGGTNSTPDPFIWAMYGPADTFDKWWQAILHPLSFPPAWNRKPPGTVIDFPVPDVATRVRGGQDCSYSMWLSTNLVDWISLSLTNTPMGSEGTNYVYMPGTNIVSVLGMTSNSVPLTNAYFRLKYESSP